MSRSKTIQYSPDRSGRHTIALPRLYTIPDASSNLSTSRSRLLSYFKPKNEQVIMKCKKSLDQINPRNSSDAQYSRLIGGDSSNQLKIHKLERSIRMESLHRRYAPCNRRLEPHPFKKYTDSHKVSPFKDKLGQIQDISCNTILLSRIQYLPHKNDHSFQKLRNKITMESENQEQESISGDLKKAKKDLLDISSSLAKEKKRKRIVFKLNRIERNAPLIQI